jgi:hypothetical protein
VTDESVRAELARTEVELVLAREHVVHSVQALRKEVVRTTDWREWVRRKPGTLLAAAFAVGFLVGKRR